MLVRRVDMIPIEWVARRIATGSYVRRTGITEGTRFDELVLEMFLKDDANHDPQITAAEAIERDLCSRAEVDQTLATTARIFTTLEEAWSRQGIQLVDLKVEYGRTASGTFCSQMSSTTIPGGFGLRENASSCSTSRCIGTWASRPRGPGRHS